MTHISELRAIVLGFLQQSLREYPHGIELKQFERLFPIRSDESVDWYKQYNVTSTIDALKLIPEVVRIEENINSNECMIILKRDLADKHLINLISRQKKVRRKANRDKRAKISKNKHPQPKKEKKVPLSNLSINCMERNNDLKIDANRKFSVGQTAAHDVQQSQSYSKQQNSSILKSSSLASIQNENFTNKNSSGMKKINSPNPVIPRIENVKQRLDENKNKQSSKFKNQISIGVQTPKNLREMLQKKRSNNLTYRNKQTQTEYHKKICKQTQTKQLNRRSTQTDFQNELNGPKNQYLHFDKHICSDNDIVSNQPLSILIPSIQTSYEGEESVENKIRESRNSQNEPFTNIFKTISFYYFIYEIIASYFKWNRVPSSRNRRLLIKMTILYIWRFLLFNNNV